MEQPYILYFLPRSRTSQKFNKSKTEQIVADIKQFFDNCTTANFDNPDSVQVTVYSAYDDSDPKELLEELMRKTTDKFGKGEKSPLAYDYPSGKPTVAYKCEWELPKTAINDALKFLISNEPLPKTTIGSLELFITYNFKLIDPTNKKELPNQQNKSGICIWLSKGKACAPDLFFPFDGATTEFWNYLDKIQNYLPFNLETKYLRESRINKKGQRSNLKKIEFPDNVR